MEESSDSPREVLRRARAAVESKDYPAALRDYTWFFDHALDGDPSSYYGVRLSYCLDEWSQLGEVFEPARRELENRFHHSLAELFRTLEPERFHDYARIGFWLGRNEQVIQRFLKLHDSDRALAGRVVRFIWTELVASDYIQVCAEYLGNVDAFYAARLAQFDTVTEVWKSDLEFNNPRMLGRALESHRREVRQLIQILEAVDRKAEAGAIALRAADDCKRRGHDGISF